MISNEAWTMGALTVAALGVAFGAPMARAFGWVDWSWTACWTPFVLIIVANIFFFWSILRGYGSD
jgi:hypothetical protein